MSNIGPVNSNASLQQMPPSRTAAAISADQQASMNKVLQQFDPETLTSADAKKIVGEFRNIGVQPGLALEDVMAAAGFSAQKVGQLDFGSGSRAVEGTAGNKAAETVRSSLEELMKSTLPADGPEGNRPPPSRAPSSIASQDSISTFLNALLDSLSTSSDSQTSSTTADAPSDPVLQSAYQLLKTNGIDASESNLQTFVQILQRNFAMTLNDTGNLFNGVA